MLRAGRYGVRVPVGVKVFRFPNNVEAGPGAHPAFYTVGTGVLSREENDRTVKLSTSLI
jgi:hypothetical protein